MIGEAPGGDRVPDVLNCRVVVERHAPDQVMSSELARIGIAQVSIVPGSVVGGVVIGRSHESAEVVGDAATGEHCRLFQDDVVVRRCIAGTTATATATATLYAASSHVIRRIGRLAGIGVGE